MKTIVLTGGGTAGHIMPNMALLPELKKYFDKIVYVGSEQMEKNIAHDYHLPFYQISAVKLVRKLTPKNLAIPFKLLKSIKQAKMVLKQINPDVIFSKGGFVSLPVVIAGHKLGIPVVSHESDMTMGLANKIIYKYAKTVCTGFESTALHHKKCVYTGSPVRNEIFLGQRQVAKKICNFAKDQKTLLFFGGSLGSQKINNALYKTIDKLDDFNIIHITGKNNKSQIHQSNYYSCEWTNQIQHFFALADIVICRAGANTLCELMALGKKMILIPLSKKQSRGDQIDNANYFAKKGYAKVIFEEDLTPTRLYNAVTNYPKVTKQSQDFRIANQKIVNCILDAQNSKQNQ